MNHDLKVMLIGEQKEAFDDENYIFELKMDGIRALVYIENNQVDIRNKRNIKLIRKFPEMKDLTNYVRHDCVLDGELYCFSGQNIDFSRIQKRVQLSDSFKIKLESEHSPAVFTVFDILRINDKDMTQLPLMERKKILDQIMLKETAHFNKSRYIFEKGIELYEATKKRELEGIVAKKKDSIYKQGMRTKEWIKIKYLLDDDFAVVGYKEKENGLSLILAQYDHQKLFYVGQVMSSFSKLPKIQIQQTPIFDIEDVFWLKHFLTAKVKFMERTAHGSLRQPVFVDFIHDKKPQECIKHYVI